MKTVSTRWFCFVVFLNAWCLYRGNAEVKATDFTLRYNAKHKAILAISADSRKAAFIVDKFKFTTLYLVDLKSGVVLANKDVRSMVEDIFFRTNGQIIYVTYDNHHTTQQYNFWNTIANTTSLAANGQWRNLSPDGKSVVVTSPSSSGIFDAEKLALYDVKTKRMLRKLANGSFYAFSHDGRYIAVSFEGEHNAILELWDARTGKTLFAGPGVKLTYYPHNSVAQLAGLVFAGREITEMSAEIEGDISVISQAHVQRWRVKNNMLKPIRNSSKDVGFALDDACEDVELSADGRKLFSCFYPNYIAERATNSLLLTHEWGNSKVSDRSDKEKEQWFMAWAYAPALRPTPDGRKFVVLKPTELRVFNANSGKLLLRKDLTP